MKKKLYFIIVMIIIIKITCASCASADKCTEKMPQVLKKGDIPELCYLSGYSDDTYEWDRPQNVDVEFYKNYYGIDSYHYRVDKTRKVSERWCSFDDSKGQIDNERIYLYIKREFYPSSKHAEEWVKREIKKRMLKRDVTIDSIFGKTCWSNREKFLERKSKSIHVTFVKDNAIINITIHKLHSSKKEMKEEFVNDVLKVIGNKI